MFKFLRMFRAFRWLRSVFQLFRWFRFSVSITVPVVSFQRLDGFGRFVSVFWVIVHVF